VGAVFATCHAGANGDLFAWDEGGGRSAYPAAKSRPVPLISTKCQRIDLLQQIETMTEDLHRVVPGGFPPRTPTDRDVRISRIRFLPL
jgi:hypothetical protein